MKKTENPILRQEGKFGQDIVQDSRRPKFRVYNAHEIPFSTNTNATNQSETTHK